MERIETVEKIANLNAREFIKKIKSNKIKKILLLDSYLFKPYHSYMRIELKNGKVLYAVYLES